MWKWSVLVVVVGCAGRPPRGRRSSAGGEPGVVVTVRNRARADVHGLALRPAGDGAWGVERLGTEALRAGQDRAFRLDDCARRDLRMVDAHGAECVLAGVAVCGENDGFTLTTDDLARCERWR